jgi:hypothetical protein
LWKTKYSISFKISGCHLDVVRYSSLHPPPHVIRIRLLHPWEICKINHILSKYMINNHIILVHVHLWILNYSCCAYCCVGELYRSHATLFTWYLLTCYVVSILCLHIILLTYYFVYIVICLHVFFSCFYVYILFYLHCFVRVSMFTYYFVYIVISLHVFLSCFYVNIVFCLHFSCFYRYILFCLHCNFFICFFRVSMFTYYFAYIVISFVFLCLHIILLTL